jgi:hypothetical protein
MNLLLYLSLHHPPGVGGTFPHPPPSHSPKLPGTLPGKPSVTIISLSVRLWYASIVKSPRLLFVLFALLLAFFLPTRSDAQKKTVSSPAPQKPAGQKAAGTKTATAKSVSKSGAKKSSKTTQARSRRPATQQQPEEQRVREIQQALTEKGYPVETNGVWGQSSVDALKKFQEDQNINNLTGRGKLDSLTLIALGLGPQRDSPSPPSNPGDKVSTEGKQQ